MKLSRSFVLLALAFSLISLFSLGCGGSGSVTGPVSTSTPAPLVQVVEAEEVALPQTAAPGEVKIWKTGAIDVTGPMEKQACYFVRGPHEQDLITEFPIDVAAGKTQHFDVPKLPRDTCVQVDVADNCNRSSIMPGLVAVEYVGPCDPPPPPPPCVGDECEPTPPPPPPPGMCYYEVDCGCTSSSCDKEAKCTAANGEWGNWYGQGDGHEQCRIEVPGISDWHFQLNKGKSDEACKNKRRWW
jgi:hypothetical protein